MGNGQPKDVKAKPVGGNVFEVAIKNSGQPLIVEDSTGKVVLRFAGVATYRYTVETVGYTIVEFLGVTLAGHFPGGSACSAAGSILGIDSASRLTAHPIGATASPLGYYEYLPPGYGSGAKKPLLIFLHGAGGNGDGTPTQLPNVINDAGIAYYIANNGWAADRPFVVLAPQHNPIDSPAYPCACGRPVRRVVHHAAATRLRQPPAGRLALLGTVGGASLPRLRAGPLQHRPHPCVSDRAKLRGLRRVGVPARNSVPAGSRPPSPLPATGVQLWGHRGAHWRRCRSGPSTATPTTSSTLPEASTQSARCRPARPRRPRSCASRCTQTSATTRGTTHTAAARARTSMAGCSALRPAEENRGTCWSRVLCLRIGHALSSGHGR